MRGNKEKRSTARKVCINIAAGFVFIFTLMLMLSRMTVLQSTGGVYLLTEHGGTDRNTNGTTGAARPANTPAAGYTVNTGTYPAGNCIHCHDEHASLESVTHTTQDYLLYDPGGANTNRYCYVCHTNTMTTGGSYQYRIWMGQATYDASAHGTNASVLWPGVNPAARAAGEQNKCTNCHNPHGRSFTNAGDPNSAQGVYAGTDPMPSMTFRIEENLCLNCHDGTPAMNISTSMTRGTNTGATGVYYTHPVTRYNAAGDRTPSAHTVIDTKPLGGGGQTARHAECTDCHNPHYTKAGAHTPPTNLISNVLLGVWGVTHTGWPNTQAKGSGTLQPTPTWTGSPVQLTNTATQYEWQLCLRCHSSYSTLPAYAAPNAVTDVAREINPNNASHHAIAAAGNNPSAKADFRNTFRAPYAYNSVIYCTDCHESNLRSGNGMAGAVDPNGPHGSANQWMLGSFCDAAAGATCTDPNQTVICFKCHKFQVYYTNASACGGANGCSRFPDHTTKGPHMVPYNPFNIWCLNCHGGGVEGGIHGSNAGTGPVGGTTNLGDHILQGSSFGGITHGTAVKNGASCWSKAAGDTYNNNATNGNCTQHSGKGQSFTPNYDY